MDASLRPLFDAILDAPEDDAPRLALAARLTELGDPRGEHIRLACALAQLALDDPAHAALAERCARLPSFAFFEHVDRDFPHSYAVRRGFVEELACSGAAFVANAARLMRAAPIRVYDAGPIHGQGASLAACPALARLRRLRLRAPGDADRAAVLASPHLGALPELELSLQLDGPPAVARLAAELRHLRGLRRLNTDYGTIGGDACAALGELARARGLDLLDVRSAVIPAAGVAQLRALLGEARVLPRPAPRVSFRFGVLDLSGTSLSPAEVAAVIATGAYASAIRLVLGRNRLGDAGVARLAACGQLPALTELDLDAAGITDAGAHALATTAVGLDHVAHLALGEVPRAGDGVGAQDDAGVSDAAVDALARSPRLPGLRSITRTKTYRHGAGGADARDDREVTPIRRADGSLVESIILHGLWP
ncbi:MAG: TIGR02996 domain-containing protein [Myxococcales bacterium]|nr:TIGR02996 domain-containing protein [Myxococcales bacterium]MBK7197632.1 TIGR02996 domain-containing protein [Myxococcales bacterium]